MKRNKLSPEQRKAALEMAKATTVLKAAYQFKVSPQHLHFLLQPIEKQKYLNKKRALMRKLKDHKNDA